MPNKFQPFLQNAPFHAEIAENPSIRNPMHYHDCYEILYLLDGKRNYISSSNIYRLNSDCITLTKPNFIHASNGGYYKRIVIYISEHTLSQYFKNDFIQQLFSCFETDYIPSESVRRDPTIKELFFQLLEDEKSKNFNLIALHCAELLLRLNIANKSNAESKTVPKTLIQQIISYTKQNLCSINNLDTVAKHFFISKYYFTHLFKKETGQTYFEYLNNIKIIKSLDLLQNSQLPIEKIITLCGFRTKSYFFIIFKNKMGITPLTYRKRNKR